MKNKLELMFKVGLGGMFALVTPFMVFAQSGTVAVEDKCADVGGATLQYIICKIALLINTIIPILIILGVLYFIWGVITYVISADEEAKTKGRDKMIYGLIGLLVIVSIWGLVAILRNTFGVIDAKNVQIPCIESPGIDCP